MRCFIHREIEAVALCSGCGKATCNSCLRDGTCGISCSDKCEREINERGILFAKMKKYYGIGSSNKFLSGSFSIYLAMGLAMTVLDILLSIYDGFINWPLFAISSPFFLLAALAYHRENTGSASDKI